jgi:hypothetical protein
MATFCDLYDMYLSFLPGLLDARGWELLATATYFERCCSASSSSSPLSLTRVTPYSAPSSSATIMLRRREGGRGRGIRACSFGLRQLSTMIILDAASDLPPLHLSFICSQLTSHRSMPC